MKSKGKLKFVGLFLGLLITLFNFSTVQSSDGSTAKRYKVEICTKSGVSAAKCSTPSPSGACDTIAACDFAPQV
jgi:hypothetical protein